MDVPAGILFLEQITVVMAMIVYWYSQVWRHIEAASALLEINVYSICWTYQLRPPGAISHATWRQWSLLGFPGAQRQT